MKTKLGKILSMILAVVMVITGIAFLPASNAKAADTPSFTVKVSSTEVKPGDTVHVELWVEGATDVISLVGNVNLDPDVYTINKRSMQFGELYTLSSQMGGMPQILPNDDQSYSVMLDFMGPAETTGMVFSFDATVNEDASGNGTIVFEYIGAERGTSDTDRHDVPVSDITAPTTDMEGHVIEGGVIPVVVELESITLDKTEPFTMKRGSTDKLSVIAAPEAALDGRTVEWTSSDDTVVSVDQSGNITAKGAGTATVSASVGGFTTSVDITVVVPLTDISLDAESIQLRKNETQTLHVLFTPTDTTDDTMVTWTSSDSTVASVNKNGTITALKEGTAVITAAVGKLTAECKVLVQEVPLESIGLNKTEITLNKGTVSEALEVLYNPADTTDDKEVIWTSDNEGVATVEDGVITAKAAGMATITAMVGKYTASCEVTVLSPLESISISADKETDRLEIGDTVNMMVKYIPSDTTDARDVIWSSSNESVASVDKNGVVTAVGGGKAVITALLAANENMKAECEVRVITHTTGITIEPGNIELIKGETSDPLTVVFEPEDTDDSREVIWTSDDTSVATVDLKGCITGVSEGTAVITATTAEGGLKASCTVTVSEIHVQDAVLADSNPSVLYVGQRHIIDVVVTPENTTDEISYTYASSDETVADVDSNGAVEALKAGNAEITITVTADEFTKELVYKLEIQDIALDGIAFREEVTPLEAGQTAQLEIIFNPDNTTVDKTVVWNSSDVSVASIEDGLVKALKAGTTVISAKVGDKEVSYELTVIEKQTPAEPSDPSTPSADKNQGSDGKVNNQKYDGAVQTGDEGNISSILLMLLISLSVIVLIVLKSRRKSVNR